MLFNIHKIQIFLFTNKKYLYAWKDLERSEVAQMLKHDDVQIGIIRGDYNWDGLSHQVYQESISIISNQELDVEDLPNLPRINYKTDPLLKQMIENWWYQTYTDSPHYVMKVDKIETCKEMVKLGLGYAIIPDICLPPSSNFVTYSLKFGNVPLIRNTWMNYREKSLNLSVIKEFVDFVTHSEIT
jgi:DNA-binding transcriptional LysR family regulator